MVPPPVRARAARPQLDAPRRVGRARGHPSVLVRPRRRGRADRLGRAAREGPGARRRDAGERPGEHPFTDRDPLHEIYRRWRAIADSYVEPRVLVGEVWLPDADRFARYLRPDELHTAFNFDFLACPWEPGPMRTSIESALAAHAPVRRAGDLGALEPRRHEARHALRPGRHVVRVRVEASGHAHRPGARHPARPSSGTARDGAAGLDVRLPGRGARPAGGRGHPVRPAPGPDVAPLGRGRSRSRRLPHPASVGRGSAAVRVQRGRGGPSLARPARRLGAAHRRGAVRGRDVDARPLPRGPAPAPDHSRRSATATCAWIPSSDSVLAFARGERFTCLVNFGPDPVDLPAGATVLLASSELEGGALPHDSTVWLRQANPQAPSGDRSPRADTASDRSNQPAPGTDPVLRKG